MTHWISVEDKFLIDGQLVIIFYVNKYGDNYYMIGNLRKGNWFFIMPNGIEYLDCTIKVLYWMEFSGVMNEL